MVGAAIVRRLNTLGYTNIITRTHQELDLADQGAVRDFMQTQKPDYVVLAAAKVGGIFANNTYPAEFIYQNLMIECNVIHEAYRAGVNRLLFLGSSCIYPKHAPQPMKEEYLLTGTLEPTNEPYAIAKIAGIKLCESYNRQYATNYRSVMPTNLYGTGDNFHLENSHVLPALLRKFHLSRLKMEGEERALQEDINRYGPIPESVSGEIWSPEHPFVSIWGSGNVFREFLHVDDMASASVHVMMLEDDLYQAHTNPLCSHINVGTGVDVTIRDVAGLIKDVVGYTGDIRFLTDRPEGTPRKLLDVSHLHKLGWEAGISLHDGLSQVYDWYQGQLADGNNGCSR
jgi:GDP-L-fucose synthase